MFAVLLMSSYTAALLFLRGQFLFIASIHQAKSTLGQTE
jgi:hypothetical protein